VNTVLLDAIRYEQPKEAGRDGQDRIGRVLPPAFYGPPERLQDSRAEVADGEGMAQARVDGEHQRQVVEPGGRSPDREDGEVLAEVHVHHVGPRGEDGGEDGRLGGAELAKAPYGEPHSYHAGVLSEALEVRRGRGAGGQHRLEDAAPVEGPGELGGVVLHPPMGSNFTPLPTSAEGGGSKTEQILSTPIRVRSLPLISQEPLEKPLAAFGPLPPLHTTLIRPLAGQRGDVRESALASAPPETAASPCKGPGR
jgi:hypothetical protein